MSAGGRPADRYSLPGAPRPKSRNPSVNGDRDDNSTTDSGAAYVFVRDGAAWVQQAYLKASNTGAGDQFGFSVAVSGDTVVVGAFLEDSSGTGVNGVDNDSASNSGAAYVFVREGSSWSQKAYLKASNSGSNDRFGVSVAASSDSVVVGAYWESSDATGVNGNQADNSASESGAVYVFSISAGVAYDLNGDGTRDVVLNNTASGQVYYWPMDGDTVVPGEGTIRFLPAGWEIIDPDFNGDGKADLLLRNPATGQVYVWLMDGKQVTGEGTVRYLGLEWEIVGSEDLNGDGAADLLLHNDTTGQVYYWPMNGNAVLAGEGMIRTLQSPWEVEEVGDYDGDGRADLLLRNTGTHQIYYWGLDGKEVIDEGMVRQLPSGDWEIVSDGGIIEPPVLIAF